MSRPDDTPQPLTHLDAHGNARMVDVGQKPVSARRAVAVSTLRMSAEALAALVDGRVPKGDAIAVARIAGIQAAKRTSEWIPLCHPLALDSVTVDFDIDVDDRCVHVRATTQVEARTGVEMEALVAASAAALALYDMLKAIDRAMVIDDVHLAEKQGGRRGDFVHPRSPAGGDQR